MDLKLTPSPYLSFYLPIEWQEVTKRFRPVRLGIRGVPPGETNTASSLVAAMSVEELRLYSQILTEISLETSDDAAISTFGEDDNAVYFTRERFVVRLRLPVPSLVK